MWADLSDRLRRREPAIDVRKTFRKLDSEDVREAVKRVADVVQSKGISQPEAVQAAQPNTTPLKTQPRNPGTSAGKYGGGKADTSS